MRRTAERLSPQKDDDDDDDETYGLAGMKASLSKTTAAYAPEPATKAGASIKGALAIETLNEEDEDDDDMPTIDGVDDAAPSPARAPAKEADVAEWSGFESHALTTGAPVVSEAPPESRAPMSYDECLAYFRALDMSRDLESIVPVEFPKRSALSSLVSSKPKLTFENAAAERDFAFLVAKQAYDPAVAEHWRLISTIFKGFMPASNKRPCVAIGGHWELVGFQGADPRTDLNRSMCCLALLQLLHLLEKSPKLARRAYRASVADDKDWPLACTSIAFTKASLQALRSGKLYKRCNALKAVLPALHEHHAAQFDELLARVNSGEDRFVALNGMRLGKKSKAAEKAAKVKKQPFVSKGAKAAAAHATEDGAFASIADAPDDVQFGAVAGKKVAKYASA